MTQGKVLAWVVDCIVLSPVYRLHYGGVSADSVITSGTDAGAVFSLGVVAPGVTTPRGAMGVFLYYCHGSGE